MQYTYRKLYYLSKKHHENPDRRRDYNLFYKLAKKYIRREPTITDRVRFLDECSKLASDLHYSELAKRFANAKEHYFNTTIVDDLNLDVSMLLDDIFYK